MSVVIAPDARRCPRLTATGELCGTILNRYNPGPDCLCHQRQPKGERGDPRRLGPTFNEVLLREYGVVPIKPLPVAA